MSDKQKAAFLRKEGWSYREWSCGHGWADPSRNYTWSLEMAYKRACRNKSQRETRRLKAAGWRYFEKAWWNKSITHRVGQISIKGGIEVETPHSKAQAIAATQSKEERQA